MAALLQLMNQYFYIIIDLSSSFHLGSLLYGKVLWAKTQNTKVYVIYLPLKYHIEVSLF